MSFDFACLVYRSVTAKQVVAPVLKSVIEPILASTSEFNKGATIERWQEQSAIMAIEFGLTTKDADYLAWLEVWSETSKQIDAPKEIQLLPTGAGCIHCGGLFMVPMDSRLICWDCDRMAWLSVDGSIVRADFADVDLPKWP